MKNKKEQERLKAGNSHTRGLGEVQETILDVILRFGDGRSIIGLTWFLWLKKGDFETKYKSVYRAVKTLENKWGYVETKSHTRNELDIRKKPGEFWFPYYDKFSKDNKPPTRVINVYLTVAGLNYLTLLPETGWNPITD